MKSLWLPSLVILLLPLGIAGCDSVVKQLVTTEPVDEDPFGTTRRPAPADPSEKVVPAPQHPGGSDSAQGETVLLDFQAEWCGPCKRMGPLVENLAERGFPVRQIDIDSNRTLARKYKVSSIPCFVLLVNGREVDRVVGMVPLNRLEGMFARNGVTAGQ